MTVPVQTVLNRYTSAGTSTFIYGFQALAVSHIVVTVNDVVKTQGTDYAVTGVGVQAGGTITGLTTVSGDIVVIRRVVPLQRTTDYQNNGDLLSSVLNPDFDLLWQAQQQVDDKASHALSLPLSSSASPTLPTPAGGAVLGWNATGTALVNFFLQAGTSLVDLAASSGSSLIGHLPSGTGTVATSVQELLNNSVSTSIFNFLSSTEKADVIAGTRTIDLQAKLQTAVNTCMLFGWNLHIPSHAKSIKIGSPVLIDYTVLGTGTLSIFGDAVKGYYQGGMGSELYYSGATGYMFQVTGRKADVGGSNQGSPMPVSFEGINFAGNTSAYGAISLSRASFSRVCKNNFYGFGNTLTGVVVVSAGSVTVGSPNAFCGEIDITENHFASSGRCVLLTGNTGGVVNVVRITDNVALDQNYFVSVDFGADIPYSESIWITGNHIEGSILNDIYSQGAASNFRFVGNYIEQNSSANNGPRVNVQGSNNYGIYVEQNTFSKSLATTALTSLVTVVSANGVSVVNNQSNYGGAVDRFSVDLVSCVNAVAEPFSAVALPLYPVRMNNYVMRTGRVTDQWQTNPPAGSGGFIGISSGDGYPGGTVCTIAVEQSKSNAQVRLNFKATITTKSGSGTSSLIGVLPYANYGTDVYFPVYTINAVGTKPFYGVLPAGLTVATIYDATGAALNYQTAFSVGSVISANFTYLTQQ